MFLELNVPSSSSEAEGDDTWSLTHLLAVALREVDDARGDGGEADERAGARVPQLRVEALLLCTSRTAQRPASISKKTNRFRANSGAQGSET